jgi:hypothetical protein
MITRRNNKMYCTIAGDLLIPFLDNEVTPEEKEIVRTHINECPLCANELDGLRRTQARTRYALASASLVPRPIDSWTRISDRIDKEQYNPHKVSFKRKKQLVLALTTGLLALLLIGGAVYGSYPALKAFFSRLAPSIPLEETPGIMAFAQEYDLAGTANGITARLEYAYADSNIVIVGLSVNSDSDSYSVSLHTLDGLELERSIGLLSNSGDLAYSFIAPAVEESATVLNLNLAISSRDQAEMEPVVLAFEVPYFSGTVVDVGQSVTTQGVTIELEKLVISRWGTRAVLHIDPQMDERGSYAIPSITLEVSEGSVVNTSFNKGNNPKEQPKTCYFSGNFTQQAGTWVLSIDHLTYPPIHTDQQIQYNSPEDTRVLSGPWVFSVQVP